jgi:hypothetical protein
MKNNNKTFWGIVLIIVGVVFLLDRLNLVSGIFFAGWWTLFLIIPALYKMSTSGVETGNLILLCVGVYFFIDAQGWSYSYLVLPVGLVVLGLAILLKKH